MTETEVAPPVADSEAEPSAGSEAVPAAPSLSTSEALRAKLTESAVPLKLGELKKDLPNPTKIKPAAAFEAEVKRLLDEEIAAGRAFAYPTAAKGEIRYWGKDEKAEIQAAALAAVGEPKTLAELKKAAKLATKADASFSDAVVDELVAAPGRLHRQPSGKSGGERHWTRDEKQAIRDAVLSAAAEPKKLNDLKKLARDVTKADKVFAEPIVDELVAAEMLHKQSEAAKAPYGKEKPVSPNNREKVTEAIHALVETHRKLGEIVKEVAKATRADKAFVESIAAEMIQGKQLHPQSFAKTPLYGRHEPIKPHVLEVGPGKKAFDALVKAGRKLIEAAPSASPEEVCQRLRIALEQPPPPPVEEETEKPSSEGLDASVSASAETASPSHEAMSTPAATLFE